MYFNLDSEWLFLLLLLLLLLLSLLLLLVLLVLLFICFKLHHSAYLQLKMRCGNSVKGSCHTRGNISMTSSDSSFRFVEFFKYWLTKVCNIDKDLMDGFLCEHKTLFLQQPFKALDRGDSILKRHPRVS